MMRKNYILILLLLASLNVFGQKKTGFLQGYIITNANDTIPGLIKYINKFPARILVDIKFKKTKNSNVKTYSPNSIKGYEANARVFHSIIVPDKKKDKRFFELVIEGYLRLYQIEVSSFGASQYSSGISIYDFLLKHGESELFEVDYKDFKDSLSKYLSDDLKLSEKIKNGEFKKKELEKIVIEYNKSKTKIKSTHNRVDGSAKH